jgi:hypothetical protein
MSNWFSNHPATSIIGHTVIIAAGVGAFCIFVLNDNRINLYKAQVETSKAQVDNSKTIAEQYIQKVSGLEAEIGTLKAENERYLAWLTLDQKSFPALSLKISNLERELEAARLTNKGADGGENLPAVNFYEFSKGFSKGESFKDPKTKAVLGVSDISANYTAYGAVTLPDGKVISLNGARPGEGWDFKSAGKDYRLTLDSVNWTNNSLKASVSEVVK